MIGAVQAGPESNRSSPHHDDEPFGLAVFSYKAFGHEHAGVADNHAARLHDERKHSNLDERRDSIRQFLGQRGLFIGIGDAKPPADIQIPDVDALALAAWSISVNTFFSESTNGVTSVN